MTTFLTVESDRLWQNLTSVLDNPISLRVVLRPLILGFVELAVDKSFPKATRVFLNKKLFSRLRQEVALLVIAS